MRAALGSFVFVVVAVIAFAFYSLWVYRTPHAYSEQDILIPPHTGGRAMLAQLHAAGVTPSLPVIALPLILSGNKGELKAGEYHFPTGLSPAQIIDKVARGEIVLHKVSIPEGWTSYQVRMALQNEPLLTGPLPADIPEGSIFPDTMNFLRGEPREAVLARMQKAQASMITLLWNSRGDNLAVATPEQAIILASVVEKETGVPTERPLVAGVFTNRLRQGMPLQSDPTVMYGITRNGPPMTRALTTVDLKTDTPYNSYTRAGLPPTPICNPGREAINAVLHPAATPALYFVATGHGGHNFANTVEDHLKNVALYHAALQAAAHPAQSTPEINKKQ